MQCHADPLTLILVLVIITSRARTINATFGEVTTTDQIASNLYTRFEDGETDIEDRPRTGRPLVLEDSALLAAIKEKPNSTVTEFFDSQTLAFWEKGIGDLPINWSTVIANDGFNEALLDESIKLVDEMVKWPMLAHKQGIGGVHRVPIRQRGCDAPCANRTISLASLELAAGWRPTARTLFSPNYPRPYCADAACTWFVNGAQSMRLHFLTNNFDVRADRDYLVFFNGFNASNYAHKCTGAEKRCEFISSGSQLAIRFVVGTGVQDSYGFQGLVSVVPENEETTTDKIQLSIGAAAVNSNERKDDDSSAFLLFLVTLVIVALLAIVALILFFQLRKMPKKPTKNKYNTKNQNKATSRVTLASQRDSSTFLSSDL